jgi:PAS domain S-box-containing protein
MAGREPQVEKLEGLCAKCGADDGLVRAVLDAIQSIVVLLDVHGRIILGNRAAEAWNGWPSDVLQGSDFCRFGCDETQSEQIRACLAEAVARGSSGPRETWVKGGHGAASLIAWSADAVYDSDGRIVCLVATVQDITSRRRSEQALRESERRLSTLLSNLPGMAYRCRNDRQWTMEYVSEGCQTLTGYEQAALQNNRDVSYAELVHPEDADDVWRQVQEAVSRGQPFRLTYRIRTADGEEKWVYEQGRKVDDAPDGTAILEGFIADVTDRIRSEQEYHRLEEQLFQVQKLEAIGELAGGVAHDFNNLLTGIIGYANLLKSGDCKCPETAEIADAIEGAARRAAQLTSQLLGFARRGKNQIVPVDLHGVVREVVDLLGRTLDKNIEIQPLLQASPSTVVGDPGQLQQMVLNLAVNARDAMPDGGQLTFRTECVDLDEEYCRLHAGVTPGRYLCLSVMDTGVGIPRDILPRIFEPFFTTKEPSKGTGMGLSMVYGIAKNHGGSVQVYSELGHGSTFRVYLPVTACPSSEQAHSPLPRVVSGRGRVLLIDDEPVVRQMAARMLVELGYDVLVAGDGVEALEIYRQSWADIDLVLLDMIMPAMGGRECFRAMRQINPNVLALLSTGYGLNGAAQKILDEGVAGFVEKPYDLARLSQAVAAVLGRAT